MSSQKLGEWTSPQAPSVNHSVYVNNRKTPIRKFKKDPNDPQGRKAIEITLEDLQKNKGDFFNQLTMDYYRNVLQEKTDIPVVHNFEAFLGAFEVLLTKKLEDDQNRPKPLGVFAFRFYIKGDNTPFKLPTEQEKEKWNALWNDDGQFHKMCQEKKILGNPNMCHTLTADQPILALAWLMDDQDEPSE